MRSTEVDSMVAGFGLGDKFLILLEVGDLNSREEELAVTTTMRVAISIEGEESNSGPVVVDR